MIGAPSYYRLAVEIRERIRNGAWGPGQTLPSETHLMQEFAVSRATVRRAIALLRSEGLVTTLHGHGTYVREQRDLEPVHAPAGTVMTRMPTLEEREALGLAEGVPVLVWSRPGHEDRVLPGDKHYVQFSPQGR